MVAKSDSQSRSNEKLQVLQSLRPIDRKIIQRLMDHNYAAQIAKSFKISKPTVCRLIVKLLRVNLVAKSHKDPIMRRAVYYSVSKELANYLLRTNKKVNWDITLVIPHNVKYRRAILSQSAHIVLDTSKFSQAQFKLIRTYSPKGGERYVFETESARGRIHATVHMRSIIMSAVDRLEIEAQNVEEATNILSMQLQKAFQQFVDEQRWNGCILSLGEPTLVGNAHYAFKSHDAKQQVLDLGNAQTELIPGFEVDNSLKETDPDYAEFETSSLDKATAFDYGVRAAGRIGQEGIIEKVNYMYDQFPIMNNNIAALCQSGLPLQNQFNQMTTIMSRQSETMANLQQTVVGVVQSMERILNMLAEKEVKRGQQTL